MPKAKTAPAAAKKSSAKKSRRPAAKVVAPPKKRKPSAKKPVSTAPPREGFKAETSIAESESRVVASKFAIIETDAPGARPARPTPTPPAPIPTLPSSYGESHLLLLVRDPQTLFAAWDMAPGAVAALRARLGARAFAVSTLTLRLTRAGGGASVIHLGKKARSRYLKIDAGPSYVAEIGFTSPAGRFDLVARSAPCFVPLGQARQDAPAPGRRAVRGYREARAVARRGLARQEPSGRDAAAVHPGPKPAILSAGPAGNSIPTRELGGASDLYRR